MEYLLAALKRKTRRLKFEQWLLLAVRILIVVLVVLAVAEPYWQRTGLVLPSGGRTHRVLVVDGSFSMGYAPEGRSRFQQAKQLARRIVEESSQGDAFTLVLMSSPPISWAKSTPCKCRTPRPICCVHSPRWKAC